MTVRRRVEDMADESEQQSAVADRSLARDDARAPSQLRRQADREGLRRASTGRRQGRGSWPARSEAAGLAERSKAISPEKRG